LRAVAPAVVGLALVAAGCGGGGSSEQSYPAKSVDAFVRTCRAQPRATDQYCRCVIDELQAKLAYADFKALDEAFSARRTPNRAKARVFYAAVERCRGEAGR
jgi:hypothetical protein